MRPPAIGYLRADISGARKVWHEIQLRTMCERLGYQLAKTVVFGEFTADPLSQLLAAVARDKAEAVVTPSDEHLGGEIPEVLIKVVDVITVSPEATYARRYPTLFDPPASEGESSADSLSRDPAGDLGGRDLAGVRRDLPPLT